MSGEHVVVIGGGLAAQRAVGTLHGTDFGGSVTVVSDERVLPYDRPPLSKAVLAGSTDDCALRTDGFDGVDWRLGRRATALDPSAGAVILDGDERLEYDRLLLATGRRARNLPGIGSLGGVQTLRTLEDARRLRRDAATASSAVIIGGGFVGCEVAATIRSAVGLPVTVVDVADSLMPVIGPVVGARMLDLHRRHGVDVRLGVGVRRLVGDDHVQAVELEDGTMIDADLVLVAVGSVPNTEWLAGSGLELHDGSVVCDAQCLATGHPEIAVAGDIAAWPHPHDGRPVVVEHWSNAQLTGRIAAANLVCAEADRQRYAAEPTFWSDQYDVKIQSVGFVGRATGYRIADEEPEQSVLVVEALRGDVLVGAIVLNRPSALLRYRRSLAAPSGIA